MKTGFTLIELILVIAILVVLSAIFLPISLDFYKNYVLNSTEDQVVIFLRQARNNAMNQKNDTPAGFYFDNSQIVVFAGNSYVSRNPNKDLIYNISDNISITGLTEIVFAQNSGLPDVSGTITISLGDRNKEVVINSEGLISY